MSITKIVDGATRGFLANSRRLRNHVYPGLGLIAALAASPNAKADGINGQYLVPSNPLEIGFTPNQWVVPDGQIVSVAGLNHGSMFGVLLEDGMGRFYNSSGLFLYANDFGVPHATGFSEVSPGFLGLGASYAVSDSSTIYYFGSSLNYITSQNITVSYAIDDIRFSGDRMFIANGGGIQTLNSDGRTVSMFYPAPTTALEILSMGCGLSDMFFSNNSVYLIKPDGTWDSSVSGKWTGYGEGDYMTGAAVTDNLVVVANPNGFYTYDKAPFQECLAYATVPEPSSVGFGLAGLAAIFLATRLANAGKEV